MTRALILNAVSTPEQARKFSLDMQNEVHQAFAASRGWHVVEVLRSDLSRSKYDRIEDIAAVVPAFKRLWELIEQRAFDWLIINSFERLNRDPALIIFLIQRIIRSGARIWSMQGGEINESNYLALCGAIAFMVAAPIKTFVEKSRYTKRELAKRGLTYGRAPFSHRVMRTENGKRQQLVVREDLRPLWDTIYQLIVVEHHALNDLENELTRRGFLQDTGQPFPRLKIHYLLHHPVFWGHMALRYAAGTQGRRVVGAWTYDPTMPPPTGIEVFYNVLPSVYTGDQRDCMIEELRFRATQSGSSTAWQSYAFTGLLVCAKCGHHMVRNGSHYTRKRDGSRLFYWRCDGAKYGKCDVTRIISDHTIRDTLDQRLREFVEQDDFSAILGTGQSNAERDRLQRETNEADRELRGLLRDSARADDDLASLYTDLIASARVRLTKARAAQEKAQATNVVTSLQRDAAAELKTLGVDNLWRLSAEDINRHLHRLLGNYRLRVEDGKINGLMLRR